MIDLAFISAWLAASIRMAAPLVLTGVGGVFNERSGVFNIGLEGMMLVGCFTAVAGSYFLGGVIVPTLLAMLAGGLLALIHAYLTVSRRTNQIVSGAAINLLALGLTNLLMRRFFMAERVRAALYPVLLPESWAKIPILGPILLGQPWIIWLAFILPPLAAWFLYRTTWGLSIRACGEHPEACETAGVSVIRLRYLCVIFSGLMAGLGGASLTLAELGYFTQNMTAGRGFVVLAALVFGKWNPILVSIACLMFGAADALQLRVQTFGWNVPYQALLVLPYVLTIAALVGFVGRTNAPKALGVPYSPEEE